MYGIVVTPAMNEAELMYVVYVEESMPLLFIKRFPAENRSKLTKEERKKLDKVERKRSLSFGDWIEFEKADINSRCIEQYKKIYPLNPSRSVGEHLQIESICVFSASARGWERDCYCDLFGRIRVDPELKNCFLSDVAYRCWISVEVTRILSLNVEVGDYIDVAEEQNLVPHAPWNRKNPRFVTAGNSDTEDDESDLGVMESKATYPYEIHGVEGVLVSERTVYSSKYPDVKIALAFVKRERRTPIGSCISFNACFSIPLHSYVVRSHKSAGKSFRVKPFEFGSLFLLEVHVNWGPELPMGYLWSNDEDLGQLIHDADGLVLPVLLGKNPYARLCVYVGDTGPSCLSRFGIKDLSEMAVNKVNAAMNSGYSDLSDDGLILGDESVLASRYICLKIRFDNNSPDGWEKLLPGTWIKFTAWSPTGLPDFRIKTWNLSTNPLLVPVRAVPAIGGYVFEARGCFEQELSAIRSPVFGFIEIPPEKRCLMNSKNKGVTVVWVREDKGNARTRFVLHSTEMPEPVVAKDVEEKEALHFSVDDIKQRSSGAKKIVTCKGTNCKGRELLQRCLNNRTIVNSLMQASANDLLASIVLLLTTAKSEI